VFIKNNCSQKGSKKVVKEEDKKRKHLQTHPWINFRINTNEFDYKLWMLLGEVQSKCEHIAGVPLKPEAAGELHRVYLFKGASATTAIEGNTLSEEEARAYVEKRLELPPSKKYLGKEIENIVDAFNFIVRQVEEEKASRTKIEDINRFNQLTLKELDLPEGVIPGKIRKYAVQVGNYRGAPAEDCQYLLQKTCEWLNDKGFSLGEGYEIASGILKAIVAHLYIAWIHPYGDGNGRTARLLELQILLDAGVPSPAAHLLSNHYKSYSNRVL
jgi:Fic family protein